MSEAELAAYRLLIVPGGDFMVMGKNLKGRRGEDPERRAKRPRLSRHLRRRAHGADSPTIMGSISPAAFGSDSMPT